MQRFPDSFNTLVMEKEPQLVFDSLGILTSLIFLCNEVAKC